jgi:hypothetical protein
LLKIKVKDQNLTRSQIIIKLPILNQKSFFNTEIKRIVRKLIEIIETRAKLKQECFYDFELVFSTLEISLPYGAKEFATIMDDTIIQQRSESFTPID